MKLFNTYEALGILASIAVMTLALATVRFKTDTFMTASALQSQNQAAVTSATDSNNNQSPNLENALKDAFTPQGELGELVIDDVRIGEGAVVEVGNTISVHYIGTTQDGTRFDSSYERNEPFTFTVGEGKVIKGWDDGLIGMKVGGQRILVIPSEMAYGNRRVGPIPPNSPLVFAVELVEIK